MNPIVTIKCPKCDRSFTGQGNRIKANLANHMKGAHPGIDWRTGKHLKVVALPVKPITDIEQIGKRPCARKPKPEAEVCFCPRCGVNLRAVKVAMGL